MTTTTTATPRYRLYRWPELAALAVLTIGGLALHGDLAGWCLLLSWGYGLIRDWRGATSLRGRIPWRRMPLLARLLAIAAYIVLYPLLFPVYVALAAYDGWQWHRGEPERTRAHIAQMERELGIGQVDDGGQR